MLAETFAASIRTDSSPSSASLSQGCRPSAALGGVGKGSDNPAEACEETSNRTRKVSHPVEACVGSDCNSKLSYVHGVAPIVANTVVANPSMKKKPNHVGMPWEECDT